MVIGFGHGMDTSEPEWTASNNGETETGTDANGDTYTINIKSGVTTEKKVDGTTTIKWPDGKQVTEKPDGSTFDENAEGESGDITFPKKADGSQKRVLL